MEKQEHNYKLNYLDRTTIKSNLRIKNQLAYLVCLFKRKKIKYFFCKMYLFKTSSYNSLCLYEKTGAVAYYIDRNLSPPPYTPMPLARQYLVTGCDLHLKRNYTIMTTVTNIVNTICAQPNYYRVWQGQRAIVWWRGGGRLTAVWVYYGRYDFC